jgi:DNA helicase-2/ATP-dependent DNA helicase PcrA
VGRIEDERRLFYVAMTRARESVHVSYARSDGEKELLPSQFIGEIDPLFREFDKLEIDAETVYSSQIFNVPKKDISVSILKQEFVTSKFLGQPLSVTHLNNYLLCPWQYFFVNLIRIPQAQSKHQMYGTAIHSVLRSFFNAMKEDRDLSSTKLAELFKHNIDMQPMSKDDRVESYKKGKNALAGYIKTYNGTWNKNLLTEYAVKRGITIKLHDNETELELTGKLDKIEFQQGNEVTVIDYKTSKPKSRNDIEGKTRGSDGNYKRQLIFYKLLLEGDKKFHMNAGEIDFIEPNERGHFKKERFEITSDEVNALKEVIKIMAEEITSLSFINSKCKDKDCQYCALGKLLEQSHKSL